MSRRLLCEVGLRGCVSSAAAHKAGSAAIGHKHTAAAVCACLHTQGPRPKWPTSTAAACCPPTMIQSPGERTAEHHCYGASISPLAIGASLSMAFCNSPGRSW